MPDENEPVPLQVGMTTFYLPERAKVEMLGSGIPLKWQKNGNGFIISVPEKVRNSPPSKYVWVMKAVF